MEDSSSRWKSPSDLADEGFSARGYTGDASHQTVPIAASKGSKGCGSDDPDTGHSGEAVLSVKADVAWC